MNFSISADQLLDQFPGCTWLLRSNLDVHSVFGDPVPVFGFSAAQLRGRNLAKIVEPGQRAYWIRCVTRVFQGETLSLSRPLAPGCASSAISLFPVRAGGGEILLAGGLAQAGGDRRLAARLLHAQEAERGRLAHALHDGPGQLLTAAGLQFDLLCMDLQESQNPYAARLAEVQSSLNLVIESIRDLSRQLSVTPVERTGLRHALDGLALRLRSGFPVAVSIQIDSAVSPAAAAAAALYRIAEEAAANAARHSGCSSIKISLKSTHCGPALEIRDDGHGFPASVRNAGGMGLLIMEQYAEQAGIDLHIDSRPGEGTTVKALCPMARTASAG